MGSSIVMHNWRIHRCGGVYHTHDDYFLFLLLVYVVGGDVCVVASWRQLLFLSSSWTFLSSQFSFFHVGSFSHARGRGIGKTRIHGGAGE